MSGPEIRRRLVALRADRQELDRIALNISSALYRAPSAMS